MIKTFCSVKFWLKHTELAVWHLAKGVAMLMVSVFGGIVSLSLALWRFLTRWVGNYPSIALGGFLVALFLVWLVTFMSMRARAVSAEAQRDSIAWKYTEFKEQHGF